MPATTTHRDDHLALVWRALNIEGAHWCADPDVAITDAGMLLVGSGKTFRLPHALRIRGCRDPIRHAFRAGVPNVGWSAGTIDATPSICATNVMPFVDPGGLAALDLFPSQTHARGHDVLAPGHRSETPDRRIAEYLQMHLHAPEPG